MCGRAEKIDSTMQFSLAGPAQVQWKHPFTSVEGEEASVLCTEIAVLSVKGVIESVPKTAEMNKCAPAL